MNRTPYISDEQREGWEQSVIDNKPAEEPEPASDEAGQVDPAATGDQAGQ